MINQRKDRAGGAPKNKNTRATENWRKLLEPRKPKFKYRSVFKKPQWHRPKLEVTELPQDIRGRYKVKEAVDSGKHRGRLHRLASVIRRLKRGDMGTRGNTASNKASTKEVEDGKNI